MFTTVVKSELETFCVEDSMQKHQGPGNKATLKTTLVLRVVFKSMQTTLGTKPLGLGEVSPPNIKIF